MFQLIPLAFLLASPADPAQTLPVELLFDGEPLQTAQRPEFSCRDDSRNEWIGCGEMVRDLAEAYVARGEPEAAIRIIERLVNERQQDVSAYNLALTFETKSRAYWALKDFESAKAAIQEGLRRFPEGWQADQLRKTPEQYEKETAKPIATD